MVTPPQLVQALGLERSTSKFLSLFISKEVGGRLGAEDSSLSESTCTLLGEIDSTHPEAKNICFEIQRWLALWRRQPYRREQRSPSQTPPEEM